MPPSLWTYLLRLSRGGTGIGTGMRTRASGVAAVHTLPGPADILEQLQMAVVATDRDCNLLYANPFAAALLGLPDAPVRLVGRSLASPGFDEGAPPPADAPPAP